MSEENRNYKPINGQLAEHFVLLSHHMTAVYALVDDCKNNAFLVSLCCILLIEINC